MVFEQNQYFKRSESCLGSSWNGLGVVLGALGALLAALGVFLGASWGDLGGSGLGTCRFQRVWATQDGSDLPPCMVLVTVWRARGGINPTHIKPNQTKLG